MRAPNRQRLASVINALGTSNAIVTCRISKLQTRGSFTEALLSVDSKANLKNIPTSYRADRFDDLPDFAILADNRYIGRRGVWEDDIV